MVTSNSTGRLLLRCGCRTAVSRTDRSRDRRPGGLGRAGGRRCGQAGRPSRPALAVVLARGRRSGGRAARRRRRARAPPRAERRPPPRRRGRRCCPPLGDAPAPDRRRARAGCCRPALRDPALGGTIAASVVDVRTGDPLLEQRADAPVVPGVDRQDRDRRRRADGARPRAAAPHPRGRGAGAGRGRARRRRRHPAGRPARAGRPTRGRPGSPTSPRRSTASGTPVTRVLVDDSAYPGPRLGPGWKPSYVTGGDVAPVERAHARRRPGARRPPARGRPTRRSPRARRWRRCCGVAGAGRPRRRRPPGARELGVVREPAGARSWSRRC